MTRPEPAADAAPEGASPDHSALPAPPARWVLPDAGVAILRDAWRTFLADPVRSNIATAHGGGTPATVAIVLAFGSLAASTAMLQFRDQLTARSTGLLPQLFPGVAEFAPAGLVPILMGLVALAAAVAMVGAVHASTGLCVLTTVAVLLVGTSVLGFAHADAAPAGSQWAGLIGTVIGALGPWTARILVRGDDPESRNRLVTAVAMPIAATAAVCVVVVPLFGVFVARLNNGTVFARDTVVSLWSSVAYELASFAAPLIYLGGLGFVLVAITASRFLGRSVHRLGGRSPWLSVIVVLALLAWRWYRLVAVRITQEPSALLLDLAAGLVGLAAATVWWRWATARPAGVQQQTGRGGDLTPEDGAARGVVLMTVVVLGSDLVAIALSLVGQVMSMWLPTSSLPAAVNSVAVWLDDGTPENVYRIVASTTVLSWSIRRRRGGRGGAMVGWVGIVAVLDLIRTTRIIFDVRSVADASVWQDLTVVIVSVFLIVQWVGHRAPPRRWLRAAIGCLLFTGLVVQQDFVVDGEVSTVLSWAGAAAPVLAVVWTLLSAGGHAKVSGVRGQGRALVIAGFLALTAALSVWPAFAGGATGFLTTNPADAAGRSTLGDPLVLAVLAGYLPRVFSRRRE